jgi:hypothetical protein
LSRDVIESVGKWALEKRGKYPVNEDDEEIFHRGTRAAAGHSSSLPANVSAQSAAR